MNVKKEYFSLLFRHYGQGFLFLAFCFYLFPLLRVGFNHINELFFLGFKGTVKINQVSIASMTMTIVVLILLMFCGCYLTTLNSKYLKSGLWWGIIIYSSIGLLGAIDLLSVQSSSLIYAKNTLITVFTSLLFRRYAAIEDKKVFLDIFPALKNRNDGEFIDNLPNISEEWAPYLKNIKGHREKSIKQSLVSEFSVWGLRNKSDSFQLSFMLRKLPFQLKIGEIGNYSLPISASLGKAHKKEEK